MILDELNLELIEKGGEASDKSEPIDSETLHWQVSQVNSEENLFFQLIGSDDIEMLYEWFSS